MARDTYSFSLLDIAKIFGVMLGILTIIVIASQVYQNPGKYDFVKKIKGISGQDSFLGEAPDFDPNNPENLRKLEQKIHDLINLEREKHGLDLLVWSDVYAKIALQHSEDMATRGYFDHTSPEGYSYEDRYQQNKLSCRVALTGADEARLGIQDFFYYYYATGGENIARVDLGPLDSIAEFVVNQWMADADYKENILIINRGSEGIGVSIKNNQVYVTNNFC